MSIYVINSKKNGKQYGIRFRSMENGSLIHKNLRPFRTQAEANKAKYKYLTEQELLKPLSDDEAADLTFNELFQRYLAWGKNNLAPSSLSNYNDRINKYVLPFLGEEKVRNLSKGFLSAWQDNLPCEFTVNYRSGIKTALSAVLTFAVNRDILEINPLQKIERLRDIDADKKITFWEKSEFDTFIKVVDDKLWKAFFTFLYVSGCRKGELFALTLKDVNFEKNYIRITKTYSKEGERAIEKLGARKKFGTKNKKTGDIYMPHSVLMLLEKLPKGKFIFGGNERLAATTVTRAFDSYIEKAGVKRIKVHDLRHSCAALIISTGNGELATLYALAERLRDSPEQILRTYGHLFPSKQAEIMKTLDKLF